MDMAERVDAIPRKLNNAKKSLKSVLQDFNLMVLCLFSLWLKSLPAVILESLWALLLPTLLWLM